MNTVIFDTPNLLVLKFRYYETLSLLFGPNVETYIILPPFVLKITNRDGRSPMRPVGRRFQKNVPRTAAGRGAIGSRRPL